MLRDMLPPLFDILTGLGFFVILLVGTLARPVFKPLWGRIAAISMLPLVLAFMILAWATRAVTMGAGAELFLAAGISIFVAIILLATALFLAAREAAARPV